MKRTSIIGLALMAMFAVSAVGTSAASAFSEFKGEFPVHFTGKGDGLSRFETPEGSTVTCEKSSSFGTVLSAILVDLKVTYSECKLVATKPIAINEPCPNILTTLLLVKPVDRLNLGTETGVLVGAEPGAAITSFECTGGSKVKVTVKGSVICLSQPVGVASTTGKVVCKEGTKLGGQEFTTALNSSGVDTTDFLTAESTLSIFKITENDAQNTTELLTYEKAVEQSA